VAVRAIVSALGSAEAALDASDAVAAGFLGSAAVAARRSRELHACVERILETCVRRAVRVLPMGHPRYPAALFHLPDPPPVLYLRGRLEVLDTVPGIAVVGARRATERGRRIAAELGGALARAGATVVSGLARGIDGAAHRGALDVDGTTLAVLGGDVLRPYPASHAAMHRQIAREGLLVSEFPPGTRALAHHFTRRNRVLAALSRAVIVVEAGRRSGALITVGHALDLGVEVFAVPGSIDSPQSEGTNRLVRDGAGVVVSIEELLRALNLTDDAAPAAARMAALPPAFQALLEAMGPESATVDQLARAAGLDVSVALGALASLEMEGWAERLAGMRYRRAG